MAKYSVPGRGQPVAPFVEDRRLWGDIIRMLAEWRAGQNNTNIGEPSDPTVYVVNNSGVTLDEGRVVQLDAIEVLNGGDIFFQQHKWQPQFTVIDPVFGTSMDRLAIVDNAIPSGTVGSVRQLRYIPVKLSSGSSTAYKWAHINPSSPTEITTGTGGIYKVLDTMPYDGDQWAILDTQESQNHWLYTVSAPITAGSLASGDIKNLDGTVFATGITIQNPSANDAPAEGWCLNIGNGFYAVNAAASFDCSQLCECEPYALENPDLCNPILCSGSSGDGARRSADFQISMPGIYSAIDGIYTLSGSLSKIIFLENIASGSFNLDYRITLTLQCQSCLSGTVSELFSPAFPTVICKIEAFGTGSTSPTQMICNFSGSGDYNDFAGQVGSGTDFLGGEDMSNATLDLTYDAASNCP